MQERETIVFSVGGSLIVPDELDVRFLKKFSLCVRGLVAEGKRVVIITGGGKTARHYQETARKVAPLSSEDLDWLGIHATRLNGHLIRAIFRDIAHPALLKDPRKKVSSEAPVVVLAGWKPGWSTDFVAVRVAKQLGAKCVINLSNIACVYDTDPKKHPEARPIPHITWDAFRALIPSEWSPGLSSPFDPVAAREAQKADLEVAVIDGAHLERVKNYLAGKKFTGTLIKD